MKLTDVKCKAAKPQARSCKLFDGGGLYLEVMPSGGKLWRLKYYFLGKEKRVSLGAYPLVSLAEARDAREDAKKLLLKNIDPSTARREGKAQTVRNAENTFKAIALEWHENQKERWSESYARKIMLGLELNVFAVYRRPLRREGRSPIALTFQSPKKQKRPDAFRPLRLICSDFLSWISAWFTSGRYAL